MGFLDIDEDVDFFVDLNNSGNASARNLVETANMQKITSKVVSLDNFLLKNEIDTIDIIKCDVEGSELLVFRGGLKTLKSHAPIIFTEMLRKWAIKYNYHPNETIQLLTSLGYRCFTIKDNRLLEFFSMNEETVEKNFFFLHRDKHSEQIRSLEY